MLLKGNWIERTRNTRPIDGEDISRSIGFDEDKSELDIEATNPNFDSESADESDKVFRQSFDWTVPPVFRVPPVFPIEEAWKVTAKDRDGFAPKQALPPSARLRMVHPNVLEVYLPLQRAGELPGRVMISYMFRASEYFEPVHDESLTLEMYQAWLGKGAEEDSDLLVWLGTSDAPIAPPRPLDADGAGIDATRVLREWTKAQDIFHFAEHLPFMNELALYRSQKLWSKVVTQMPFLVETMFEAVPQSLLQTSAMVIYSEGSPEDITNLQLASVGISVTSLIAKMYAACGSMVPQMFFFKGACLCYDLVCLFYTFTALWAAQRDDPDAVQVFFLTRPVDWASAIYVWAVAVEVIVFWIAFVSLCVRAIVHRMGTNGCKGGLVLRVSLLPFACILALLPMGILIMSIRMSWAVAMIKIAESKFSTNYKFYRQAYAFVHSGADVHESIKAVNHALLGEDTTGRNTLSASVIRHFRLVIWRFRELTTVVTGRGKLFMVRCQALCELVVFSFAAFGFVLARLYAMVYPHLTLGIAIQKSLAMGRPLNAFGLYLYVFLSLCFLLAVAFSPVARRFLRFAVLVHAVDRRMASEDEKLQEVREAYMGHHETTSPQPQQKEEDEEEEEQQQQEQAPTGYGNIITVQQQADTECGDINYFTL